MDIEKAIKLIEKEIGNQEYDLQNPEIPLPIRAIISEDINAMKAAVEALKFYERNRWIPVEERLPDTNGEYAGPYEVTTANGRVEGEMWFGITGTGYDPEEPVFHRWDDEMWQCFTPEVIAWREYPEPYQRNKEKEKTNGSN